MQLVLTVTSSYLTLVFGFTEKHFNHTSVTSCFTAVNRRYKSFVVVVLNPMQLSNIFTITITFEFIKLELPNPQTETRQPINCCYCEQIPRKDQKEQIPDPTIKSLYPQPDHLSHEKHTFLSKDY